MKNVQNQFDLIRSFVFKKRECLKQQNRSSADLAIQNQTRQQWGKKRQNNVLMGQKSLDAGD